MRVIIFSSNRIRHGHFHCRANCEIIFSIKFLTKILRFHDFRYFCISYKLTADWSKRRVARHFDRLECAVRTCWEQSTRDGKLVRLTGSGSTRNTTKREDWRIVQQVLSDPTVTRPTIQSDVGMPVVSQTIFKRMRICNPSAISWTAFNTETSAIPPTILPKQSDVACEHSLANVVF